MEPTLTDPPPPAATPSAPPPPASPPWSPTPPTPPTAVLPPAPVLPPTPDFAALDEPALVAYAVAAQVAQNAAHARRLRAFAELHARCTADHQARRAAATQSHFVLTPSEETGIEFGTALGISAKAVEVQLDLYTRLATRFPAVWARCESGRLDLSKAGVILDAADTIAAEDDVEKFAAAMEDYFTRHDTPTDPLVTLTRDQIAAAARYRKLKYRQKDDETSFHEAFTKRRARLRLDETGMGHLGCTHQATDLAAADHRLTLIAKKLLEHDDSGRTLEQMRADVLLDLLLGRLDVHVLTSELEDDETLDGHDPITRFGTHRVGAFARPVVVVTVPITTLLGAGDEPGLLSGDIPLPADLVRRIADDPDSTWYRLLTDEAGHAVHLSTSSYEPTPPIWRSVVTEDRTCVWPGCSRPSARCHTDHRIPHPIGPTCECNLWPLCPRHHKAKHSDRYTLRREPDGTTTLTTSRGTTAHRPRTQQPVVPVLSS